MGCDEDGASCAFAWFFLLIDTSTGELITYGRHTFTFVEHDAATTEVTSSEKAAGPNVAANSVAWTNALQESLIAAVDGVECLQRVFQATGALEPASVAGACAHFIP
jgi:hypothetical protein